MKRSILAAIALLATIFSVSADDRHIAADQIPAAAKTFISNYFGAQKITYATIDRGIFNSEYNVRLEAFSGGIFTENEIKQKIKI